MADSLDIQIMIEGAEETATQFQRLAAAELEAAESAEMATVQLTELAGAEAMASSGAADLNSVLGSSAGSTTRFASSQRQAAGAAQMGARALGDTRRASQAAGRQMGMMVNSVSELGFMFGQAIPGMQQYGTSLAMMGGNAIQFGAALGPLGVAIGVVTGLMPMAIQAMNDWGDSTEDAADSVHDLGVEAQSAAADLGDLTQALRDQARERALTSRVEMGLGTALEQQAYTELGEQELADAEERLQEAIDAFGELNITTAGADAIPELTARRDELSDAVVEARRELERRQDLERMAQREREEDMRRELLGDEEERRVRRDPEAERKRAEAVRSASELAIDAVRDEYERREEMARAHTQMLIAEDRRRAQERREAMAAVDRDIQNLMRKEDLAEQNLQDKRMMRIEQEKQAAREAQEQLKSDAQSGLQPVISGLTSAISEVVAGTKTADEAFQGLLSSFLGMIAERAAVEAAAQYAAAIGAFASYQYDKGAQHIAAGVAWTGVAIAAGAGAAATAPSEAQPASPGAGSDTSSQGANQYTVNINGPVIGGSGRAEVGRELGNLIREGDRRYRRAG